MMHLRCSSPLFLVAFLLFLVGSPSFAHTPPAPQTNTGFTCPPPCKCTCPTPPLPPNNGGSTPPPNNGGSTPPLPPNNGGLTPPPNNGGSTPPLPPNNGGSTPPPNNGGSTPPPNNGGSTPPLPPNNGGSTPPPNNGGSTPPLPPNNGGSTPPLPPNNGGSTPPPNNGGSTPPLPPNNGGSTPPLPPNNGGSSPPLPPNNGGSTPPPNNGGSTPPLPPKNTGSAPPLPPSNGGSVPPVKQNVTGSLHEQAKGHIENFVHSVYNGSFSMVFAFGDSYTDTGNALSLGSLSDAFSSSKGPIQGSVSTSGSVSVSGSITTHGNPSNNRCSNGRLVIDFVSEAIGLPSPPPYKSQTSSEFSYGANFAIAGATSLSADSFAKIAHNFITKGTPLGTHAQTEWFNEYWVNACKGKSKSECDSKIQNALFWVGEIGFNDYMRAANSPFSLKSIQELCTRDVIGLVKVILEGGGKYIVVQGLPPMGCLPFDVAQTKHEALSKVGCSVAINSAITVHNQVLHLQLNQLRKQYPDREILYANFWDAFMTILKNSRKFNFTENFKVCCGAGGNNLNFVPNCLCGSPGASACKDPSQYINWDGIHLTEAMYKQVTDLFLNQGFCQPSFEQMVKKKSGT